MPYRMQVKARLADGVEEWKDVRPTGANAKPYEYDTADEARRMLNICYPDQQLLGGDGTTRIREVVA